MRELKGAIFYTAVTMDNGVRVEIPTDLPDGVNAAGKSQFRDLLFHRGEPRFYALTSAVFVRSVIGGEDPLHPEIAAARNHADPRQQSAFL